MPISLAPIKYRNVSSKQGGPIDRIIVGPGTMVNGQPCFHASAALLPDLRPAWLERRVIYGNAEGSGTHASRTIACHIAISEAIERWAFFQSCERPNKHEYGFDSDRSTTGMAAFPGITCRAVRDLAHKEALERWAISEWWNERLPCRVIGDDELQVLTPFPGICVSLLHGRSEKTGRYIYGFSAGPDHLRARNKAMVELTRNLTVLDSYSNTALPTALAEKRLMHFSTEHGHSLFMEKCLKGRSLKRAPSMDSKPNALVDKELRGPWTRFAQVWRVLFAPGSSIQVDTESVNVFDF